MSKENGTGGALRDRILGKRMAPKRVQFEIKMLEMDVWLRSLTAYERVDILREDRPLADRMVRIWIEAVEDEKGQQVFSQMDYTAIGELPYEVLGEVVDKVLELTGINAEPDDAEEAVDEVSAAKNA